MIRRLSQKDDPACQNLLSRKPAENLFIIGDIENFGYEQEFQKVWGDFTDDGDLIAVLLKYRSNYICYAEHNFDAKGLAEVINNDLDFKELSGLEEMTEKLLPYIERTSLRTRTLYYAKCESNQQLDTSLNHSEVRMAAVEDVPKIVALQDSVPEFEKDRTRADSLTKGMENGSSRTFYLERDGKIVSSASTTAENSMSAMVVGVCTHANYKQRGFASLCMTRLCKELLSEGKMLCLFYDNPAAGSIYKRIGFEDIGKWMMHIYEPVCQTT
ncbi:GNAT family N-acetyltransferase [Halobacillus sp. BBL2006]|uniref:GNAT family N-acetyltransferase n=1 Tax=Halobacillus sp. BBL2006 TaxID=1543706 RepID=UPI000541E76F|nr:GNAT family N-acetyltransferase [Halobacillus sp. BBL2006]KHE69584.1 GNAT family acetyltraansferase [Halobacillus sp. BBL2006]